MSLEKVVADLVQKVERRFYGKYRGFVVDNADPEQLGRLRLKVPSVLGPDVVTGWALPCVPYGGAANQGMVFIPEAEAGVWVEFEEGDLEFPIWVGTFWSKPGGSSELPLPNLPDGSEESAIPDPPTRKIIKTLKGHSLQLEDKDDAEMVTLVEATNGHVITMNKDGITITDGANSHTIVMSKDGVTVTDGVSSHAIVMSKDGITITDGANSGNTVVMGSSGVTVKSSGTQIDLGASGVKLGGSGATEPFVLGNQLSSLISTFLVSLNTHTHIGNLGAPTSPPVAPMQLQLTPALSTKHKVE